MIPVNCPIYAGLSLFSSIRLCKMMLYTHYSYTTIRTKRDLTSEKIRTIIVLNTYFVSGGCEQFNWIPPSSDTDTPLSWAALCALIELLISTTYKNT